MPPPSLGFRLARATGLAPVAVQRAVIAAAAPRSVSTTDLAAGLRALRLDRRAFCRRVHLDGWRQVGELAASEPELRLEIDPGGAWPVALRAASIFAEARIVGDGASLPWGRELVREVLRTEPDAGDADRTAVAGIAPLEGAHLRLLCEQGAGGDDFFLHVLQVEPSQGAAE